jgi:CRP/FNR family transcriptional regulator, cyclic AMP receptor protein
MKAFEPLRDEGSVLPILASISILGGVSEEKLDRIFRKMEIGVYHEGEFVFRCGDEPTHIYIVKSGTIDLAVFDGGEEVWKEELHIGECFGEAALMSMCRHTANVVARSKSEVLVLSRHALIAIRREDIELFALLMMNIARELARRLKLTDDILLHYRHVNGGPGQGLPGKPELEKSTNPG